MLIHSVSVVLKTTSGKPRFFLFTGSRITETESQAQAEQLGAFLVESGRLASQTPWGASLRDDPFHRYRLAVEISGGLTLYSENNGEVKIRSTAQ